MIIKSIIQWACLIFAILSGLTFLLRDNPNHRPHDLIGSLGYIAATVLIQIYWR